MELGNCTTTDEEFRLAKFYGEKKVFSCPDGTVTAYVWENKLFVTEVDIVREK